MFYNILQNLKNLPYSILVIVLISFSCSLGYNEAKEIRSTQSSVGIVEKCHFPNVTVELTSTYEPWSEQNVVSGLRVWHLICLILIGLLILIIVLCCFMKCRVPRTKEEIEENHRRNKMVKRFRKHLRNLRVEEEMDLITVIHEVARIHQNSQPISSKLSIEIKDSDNQEIERLKKSDNERLSSNVLNIFDEGNKLTNLSLNSPK